MGKPSRDKEWRSVLGFSRYEISNTGEVRTAHALRTRPQHYALKGRDVQGYRQVKLTDDDGTKKRCFVHRLVCVAFHGEPPTPLHEVAHNNGVRNDNRACNLRWATRKENHADIQKHGTHVRGERNGRARLTEGQVRFIKWAVCVGDTDRKLADLFGVGTGTIHSIRTGRNWRHV